jgi:TolB-like protein
MSLLAELRRRNVFRAGAFYAASMWLLVQVATQVFPFFHIAEWVVRWIVIAAVIGFPFALLFSWFYEWTPQGLQRESEVGPDESIARNAGKKLDRGIIAVLGLAVVLLLTDKFVLHKNADDAIGKSIAVLPLLNEGGDPHEDYFSDGLSEELIANLAQIDGLKVIGRSSSFRFKGGGHDSKIIGEKLGVDTLLEGTVRRQGERVRIVAELINAADGRELWSQKYDRELKDIFAVQSGIARRGRFAQGEADVRSSRINQQAPCPKLRNLRSFSAGPAIACSRWPGAHYHGRRSVSPSRRSGSGLCRSLLGPGDGGKLCSRRQSGCRRRRAGKPARNGRSRTGGGAGS